ncbi:hypothetical protein CFAL_11395 [Corynebacterium falsenii DSM 44353]|nr:hypothetical protein CFAL_11395 [Corynebacterium falsenii DSM 44353]
MLCHPEPHPAVNYALRNVKSPFKEVLIKVVAELRWLHHCQIKRSVFFTMIAAPKEHAEGLFIPFVKIFTAQFLIENLILVQLRIQHGLPPHGDK